MAQAQKTSTPARAWTLEPEKVVSQQRFQRALQDPEVLDKFLVNPEEVAGRFDVTLDDDEITAIRNASHFLASWELLCGDGQWSENTRFDNRTVPSGSSIPEATVNCIRARIAEEILQDLPRTLQQVVSEFGGDVLIDPQEKVTELPEHVQPLARTLRRFAKTLVRGVTRQLAQRPAYSGGVQSQFGGGMPYSGMQQQPYATGQQPYIGGQQPYFGGQQGGISSMTPVQQTGSMGGAGNGITAPLGQVLAQYLHEVVNDATQEAMEHIRPQFSRRSSRWRRSSPTHEQVKEPTK